MVNEPGISGRKEGLSVISVPSPCGDLSSSLKWLPPLVVTLKMGWGMSCRMSLKL